MVVATTVNDLYDKCEIRCSPNKITIILVRKEKSWFRCLISVTGYKAGSNYHIENIIYCTYKYMYVYHIHIC